MVYGGERQMGGKGKRDGWVGENDLGFRGRLRVKIGRLILGRWIV